ncbi:MAG: rhomboid family intramembrane serine protease [Planctomycetales bacterium]
MRQVGLTTGRSEAEQFTDYLLTKGMSAHVEPAEGDSWAIWIHQEDHVDQARREFEEFRANPEDPRFQNVASEARNLRRKEAAEHKASERRIVDMRRRWAGPLMRDIPVTMVNIGICVVVAFTTNFGSYHKDDHPELTNALMFRARATTAERILLGDKISPTFDIRRGEVWRLVTPIFLHFSGMHLLFNMLMFHNLAGRIEFLLGKWRLLTMILVIAIISNTAQALLYGPYFGGMSGVVYGLFIYIWLKGILQPSSAFGIAPGDFLFMMIWLLIGMSDSNLHIANGAHLFGALSGAGIAVVESQLRRILGRR